MEENKRGRKPTVNVKDNKNYYNEYYHKTNKLVKCTCGQDIFSRSLRVHQKSKRHGKLTELLKDRKDLGDSEEPQRN